MGELVTVSGFDGLVVDVWLAALNRCRPTSEAEFRAISAIKDPVLACVEGWTTVDIEGQQVKAASLGSEPTCEIDRVAVESLRGWLGEAIKDGIYPGLIAPAVCKAIDCLPRVALGAEAT